MAYSYSTGSNACKFSHKGSSVSLMSGHKAWNTHFRSDHLWNSIDLPGWIHQDQDMVHIMGFYGNIKMKPVSSGKERFSKMPLKIALSNNGLGGPWQEHQYLFCVEKCIWEGTTSLSICKRDC